MTATLGPEQWGPNFPWRDLRHECTKVDADDGDHFHHACRAWWDHSKKVIWYMWFLTYPALLWSIGLCILSRLSHLLPQWFSISFLSSVTFKEKVSRCLHLSSYPTCPHLRTCLSPFFTVDFSSVSSGCLVAALGLACFCSISRFVLRGIFLLLARCGGWILPSRCLYSPLPFFSWLLWAKDFPWSPIVSSLPSLPRIPFISSIYLLFSGCSYIALVYLSPGFYFFSGCLPSCGCLGTGGFASSTLYPTPPTRVPCAEERSKQHQGGCEGQTVIWKLVLLALTKACCGCWS